MEFETYYEFISRGDVKVTISLFGIIKIVTDSNGTSVRDNKSFPRIFLSYSDGHIEKLDFNDDDIETSQKVYQDIKRLCDKNMKYLIENNLADQVMKNTIKKHE